MHGTLSDMRIRWHIAYALSLLAFDLVAYVWLRKLGVMPISVCFFGPIIAERLAEKVEGHLTLSGRMGPLVWRRMFWIALDEAIIFWFYNVAILYSFHIPPEWVEEVLYECVFVVLQWLISIGLVWEVLRVIKGQPFPVLLRQMGVFICTLGLAFISIRQCIEGFGDSAMMPNLFVWGIGCLIALKRPVQ